MRPIALGTTLFALSLTTLPLTASAQDGQTSPDYNLAYVLATASYCAYAVGEADTDGGEKRAVDCLTTAARLEGSAGLAEFQNILQANVEAFYNPDKPEDAYLLIQTPNRVILAFRGTLTPPIPAGVRFPRAVGEALAKYQAREGELLQTFITDWKNNFNAEPNSSGRHSGFDIAWSGLRDHLMGKDSKFRTFASSLHGTASPRLYITGHSKGGALATLATLDLHDLLGGDIAPVTYTFAGAKALTADAATQHSDAFKDMWRFEHQDDIVPDVPPDSTVTRIPFIQLPTYAHVGSRAFFMKGASPQLSPAPKQGVDAPGDLARLATAVVKLFSPGPRPFDLFKLKESIQNLGEVKCDLLVDNHFGVFSDVRELVLAQRAGASNTITEENLTQSFFFSGLSDDQGKILPGYSEWCLALSEASAK